MIEVGQLVTLKKFNDIEVLDYIEGDFTPTNNAVDRLWDTHVGVGYAGHLCSEVNAFPQAHPPTFEPNLCVLCNKTSILIWSSFSWLDFCR